VYEENTSKVVRKINWKCWREASVLEFLYNLLAKLKSKAWNLYTIKATEQETFHPEYYDVQPV
jgi:hypothetical protein